MSFTKRGVIANNDIDSIEDVAVIEVEGMKYLWIAFVVGVANLSAFTVDGKVLDTGDWFPLAAASGDYTSPFTPYCEHPAISPPPRSVPLSIS